jgi:ParB-like chromosome segregation protein Spo0J
VKNRDITLLALRNLRPNTRNARTHSKKQIKQITNSIRRFGWTYPILADENGTILAGHGRYLAALELGLPNVPVMTLADLSEIEKRAWALADNKVALNAGWDRVVPPTLPDDTQPGTTLPPQLAYSSDRASA